MRLILETKTGGIGEEEILDENDVWWTLDAASEIAYTLADAGGLICGDIVGIVGRGKPEIHLMDENIKLYISKIR